MSKLFNRAKVQLENAKTNWAQRGFDDAYVDAACYNLQQAIEFSLKYLINLYGGEYVENHDIRAQLNRLTILNVDITTEPFLTIRNMASTLNSWEAETRYKDSFTAVTEDIEAAFDIAVQLVSMIDNKLQAADAESKRKEAQYE